MRKIYFITFIHLIILLLSTRIYAQTEVYGYVKDANTQEVLPFVNVYFQGTQTGITTDIKGFFEIKTTKPVDTLVVSYIGYKSKKIDVPANKVTEIEVFLEQDIISLKEVLVRPGENPAFKVMRKAVEKKKDYSEKKLEAYEVESYTKIEAYIDKMTPTLENRKVIQKIVATVDSIAPLRNKKGQKMIPIFFSESISKLYLRNNPQLSKEEVINSNIKGILVGDNSIAQQFVGSAFQKYDFYDDWMELFGKQFVSPLANGWKLYYDYELTDSIEIEGNIYYQIEFEPKNKKNLAFIGKMLIEKGTYALKSINANITENTNINYLSGMQIDQEMVLFEDNNVLLPETVNVKLDVDPILGVYPGMYVQFNLSYQDYSFIDPKPKDFFDVPVKVLPKPILAEEEFWQQKRHVPLNEGNQQISSMIDDIRDIRMVKTYEDLLEFGLTGYFEWGKLDVGPYPYLYTYNDVEGSRIQIGGRTNDLLSNKWELDAYLGFGERDGEFKYKASLTHILSRAPWRTINYTHTYDLNQLGLKDVNPDDNPFFYASSRFGTLIKPYYNRTNQLNFKSDIRNGLSVETGIKTSDIHPDFDFGFYENSMDSTGFQSTFKTSELSVGIRYAKGEKFLIDGNRKLVVGRNSWPVLTLKYNAGIKGLLDGDFNYHQLTAGMSYFITYDGIGLGKLNMEAGRMFSTVPYPLLKVHTGNEGYFFSGAAFNLMNFYEFVSDSYVSMKYTHYFEGIILNNVPLLKKLNWRLVGITNVVYGGMSSENKKLAGEELGTENGFLTLNEKPYVELGYGIENIFKVIRVDFYHRLTYLDNPNISKFGVKINFQIIL
ncbi:carboxypeptidase-like regulatory domain-containing protein [Marivirga sp. S37H4]|uniref:Carboxypeptidase-like regulatory domain-containing protein n=1 Tax=Marivirga aurantiaca TaxID=2802615 RepID=A0A935C6A0_9BACT|nr:DUF5686 and carboxypeptidase-like regulatory domain-containing protein [Marivirga aurantiaca]MBK6264326.1 carboxypeptidase-like regulatory domain-containing protein [Marivirga aurantiaca]